MKKLTVTLLLICFIFISGKVFSQTGSDTLPAIKSIDLTGLEWGDLYVRTTDGIFLREKPTLHSKIICSIPFGERVKFVKSPGYMYPYDSAEFDLNWSLYQYLTTWVIVSYGGHNGFAFNGYLSESRTSLYDSNNSSVQLLLEGSRCIGDIAYNPAFHWYGCYVISKDGEQYTIIKPVKIKITTYEGVEGAASTSITTNQPDISKFLFGMDKEIKTQKLRYSTYYDMETFLYPGQRILICPNSSFYATGCADTTINEYGNYVKNYKLWVQNRNQIQDLTKDFNYKAESGYKIISWFGDLNDDGSPDALFSTGGYHGVTTSLYIGSKYFNDDSSVMNKVSSVKTYNCY